MCCDDDRMKVRRLRVDVVKQEELGVQAAQVSIECLGVWVSGYLGTWGGSYGSLSHRMCQSWQNGQRLLASHGFPTHFLWKIGETKANPGVYREFNTN